LVIRLQIDVHLTQRRYLWDSYQVAHRIKGGNLAVLQEQAEGGFHLALRGRRGQVQHAHVVPIGVLRLVSAQRIVGLAEGQRREQVREIDPKPYRAYSSGMAKPRQKGAEEARNQLPSLLDDAARGHTTIITRRGRSIAALVPVDAFLGRARQKGLIDLIGSGKGLWGSNRLRRLRDEWSR